jgi:predicted dienelactone hydrolase
MHWIAAFTLAVGFRQVMVGPTAVNIWYPSDGHATQVPAGLYRQSVVVNGPIRGRNLPLIVMSHGVSGSGFSDYNVALALANAGYVVAAVTHPGDNYQDQSAAGKSQNLIDRPRHIHRLVDYMVAHWPVDANRIGAFGFSLGGFTALVLAGGTPDLRQSARLCRERPDAPECAFVAERHGNPLDSTAVPDSVWDHDARIRAVALASPAVLVMFRSGGLRGVHVPVLMWRGTADPNAPDAWNAAVVRSGLPTPPQEHVVPNAGHFVFTPVCSDATAKQVPFLCDDPPGVDRAVVLRQFEPSVVAFFDAHITSR